VLNTEQQVSDAYGATIVSEGLNGIDWSPDGEWLVYAVISSTLNGDDYINVHKIVRAKADGSGSPQVLVSRDEAEYVVKPIWSPDGSLIYYAQWVQSSRWHVFSISSSGGEPRDITARISPNDFHSIGCM
jgi:Tol biopolymer transport system component